MAACARLAARYAVTREVVARQGVTEKSFHPVGGSPLLDLHLTDLRRRAQDFDPLTRDRFLAGALLPANTIGEFLALAKASPGKLNFGSYGTGSTAHLLATKLNRDASVEIVHVPFNGPAPAGSVSTTFCVRMSITDTVRASGLETKTRPAAPTADTLRLPHLYA